VDERRRLSFGGVADLYDQARPSYPSALVDDVLEYAGAGEGDRAVEVGAGTGKATALFAARGLNVVAIEPSAEMATIARRNCEGYPNVRIEETEFERWRPEGHKFRLLFSGQAWHWIAPGVRYVAARAALEEGGALAAFWNVPDWSTSDLREELGEVYRRHGRDGDTDDPMNPRTRSGEQHWATEIGSASGFDAAEVRCYLWHLDYTTAEYLDLLGTHSACLVLDAPEREGMLTGIGAAIDGRGGSFRMHFETLLCLARAS
jgi:trans-aconitate methyltransferase